MTSINIDDFPIEVDSVFLSLVIDYHRFLSIVIDFVTSKNEERESKTARKMAQVKERGGGGEERKETLADKPQDFENRPLGLSCLSARTDICCCQQLS